MEHSFEKYIEDHRNEFEKGEPSPLVWQKMEQELSGNYRQKSKLRYLWLVRRTVAAAAILIMAIGTWLLWPGKTNHTLVAKKEQVKKPTQVLQQDTVEATTEEYMQTIYYYTQLTQLKQKQIKRLQYINPQLYAESKEAIDELDKMYKELNTELPGSIDQEKVLISMINILKMQESILNRQLELLKKNKDNKHADDKSI